MFQCFRQLSLPQFRCTLSRALDYRAGGCQRIDCSGLLEASYGIDVPPLFQRDETVGVEGRGEDRRDVGRLPYQIHAGEARRHRSTA